MRINEIFKISDHTLKFNIWKITNLWEYTCVFWCEDGAVFSDETGIGNKEFGEILVGVVCPDLGLELCLALPWVGWELLLCEGGKSGCACRELWLIACGMGKIDVFVVEGNLWFWVNFVVVLLGPGILKEYVIIHY